MPVLHDENDNEINTREGGVCSDKTCKMTMENQSFTKCHWQSYGGGQRSHHHIGRNQPIPKEALCMEKPFHVTTSLKGKPPDIIP